MVWVIAALLQLRSARLLPVWCVMLLGLSACCQKESPCYILRASADMNSAVGFYHFSDVRQHVPLVFSCS